MESLDIRYSRYLLVLLVLVHQCVGPPTKNKVKTEESDEKEITLNDLGLEYNRYLKEVVDTLESDKEFAKKLQSASDVDFRNGKVAAELEYVNHHVRTKLDELKRTELQRLRDLVAQLNEQEHQQKREEMHAHLDHSNPHTFEVADLHNLILKVRKDLDEADRLRKENFKEYELQKEFEKEQKLKTMDEKHKEEYLKEIEEQKKKHKQHEPIHQPGGKAQLEEVWEKTDHMENVKFDPKAFFYMHDIDSNGYWDEEEVKALFLKELNKMYTSGSPEDDMREREEEMERMREHVFNEADTNHDRLISLEEFIEQTKKQEFQRDEGWETLDEKPQFTREEYLEFEKRRQAEINSMIERGLLQPYPDGMQPIEYHHPGQGQVPPNGVPHVGQYPNQGYVQHPNQVPQYHPNQMPHQPNQMPYQSNQMPHHPNQVPQHPNQMPHHPNQVPQHPNQMPHHPNQVPQHPNQIPHHPNQVPQQPYHTNQVPQYPNQVPNHVAQNHNQNQNYQQANQQNHYQTQEHYNQVNQGQHNNQVNQGQPQQQVNQNQEQHNNQVNQGQPNYQNQPQQPQLGQMSQEHNQPSQQQNQVNQKNEIPQQHQNPSVDQYQKLDLQKDKIGNKVN
ncbi:nucleobindin-2 isoform X2 [Cimex lectularius]|uniref:EF-hand domain-containing protein n=1 Tax=Cimex lectularius TaxID=79782 RepID=A0A8I6RVV7_CIMLE|nr:nucleobindin-2 isoform X2 [Cimex lectularius]